MFELSKQEEILIQAVRQAGQGVNSILYALSIDYAKLAKMSEQFPEIYDRNLKASQIFETVRMENIDKLFDKEKLEDIVEQPR